MKVLEFNIELTDLIERYEKYKFEKINFLDQPAVEILKKNTKA